MVVGQGFIHPPGFHELHAVEGGAVFKPSGSHSIFPTAFHLEHPEKSASLRDHAGIVGMVQGGCEDDRTGTQCEPDWPVHKGETDDERHTQCQNGLNLAEG